ncbi:MAG: XdhC family protein [Acidobacteriia bacterium]|nr:XdhC family protein [Terriglobia bacterium]
MFDDFLKKSAELAVQGESFAVATVVRCEAPTSGKPGDKAIIHADGKLWGWIGGGCAQPVVVKEALKSLSDGRPRLVRISPSSDGSEEGVVDYTMTCHSGGVLDIYIEPVLPKPHVVILGRSPIAQTLARLSRTIGYAVSVVAEELSAESFADAELIANKDFDLSGIRVTPQTYVVVSTQGEDDEGALEQAVRSNFAYVAFVASRTKSQKLFDYLRGKGIAEDRLKRVRVPAGLNIGASTPEEIAVSILAELIQQRAQKTKADANLNAKGSAGPTGMQLPVLNSQARDPICGMSVDTSKAKYKREYQGKWFYFCCGGCEQKFAANPQEFANQQ